MQETISAQPPDALLAESQEIRRQAVPPAEAMFVGNLATERSEVELHLGSETDALTRDKVQTLIASVDAISGSQKLVRQESERGFFYDRPSRTTVHTESLESAKGMFFKSKVMVRQYKTVQRSLELFAKDTRHPDESTQDVISAINSVKGPSYQVYFRKQSIQRAEAEKTAAMQTALEEARGLLESDPENNSYRKNDALNGVKFAEKVIHDKVIPLESLGPIHDEHGIYGVRSVDSMIEAAVEATCTVRTYKSRTSGGDIIGQYDRLTSDGVSDSEVAAIGVPVGETLAYINGVAAEFGINSKTFNEKVARNLNRDQSDFIDIAKDLLKDCQSPDEKQLITKTLVRSFIVNGSDERSKFFGDKKGLYEIGGRARFSSWYDASAYYPQTMRRTLEQSVFLLDTITQCDAQEGGPMEMVPDRELVINDMLDNLEQLAIWSERTDLSHDEMATILTSLNDLPPDDHIRAISVVARAYRTTEGINPRLEGLFKTHDEFVPFLTEAGYVADEQLKDLAELDAALGVMKDESDQAIGSLLLGDMGADIVEQIASLDETQSVNQMDAMDKLLNAIPNSREAIGQMLRFRANTVARQRAYIEEAAENSTNNIVKFHKWAIHKYGEKLAKEGDLDLIGDEAQRIEGKLGVSINISPESLMKVLASPQARLKALKEVSMRDPAYSLVRDYEEQKMGIGVTANLLMDPQPIYGAVTSPNGRDEHLGAAPGGYGGLFIELDNDRIADRCIVTPRDSFYVPTRDMRVPFSEAAEVVAINNLVDASYVEAQILGGVTLSDVKSVNVPSSWREDLGDMLEKIRTEYPHIAINFVEPKSGFRKKQSIKDKIVSV